MKMLFGSIMLVVGVLIALLSGLCSGWFIVMMATDGGGGITNLVSMLPAIFLFGGIPFLIGLGLLFWGRYLIRSAQNDQEA